MPRMLCLGGLVVAGLVFLLFVVDFIMTVANLGALFRYPRLSLVEFTARVEIAPATETIYADRT
jgi:hypothetical protein